MRLTPDALGTCVLCKRHNEALSDLDQVAVRLFDAFDVIETNFSGPDHAWNNNLFLFNGHDIERWLLKALCGAAAGWKETLFRHHPDTSVTVPVEWLRILFAQDPFPNGAGLYFSRTIGQTFEASRSARFSPVGRSGRLVGARLGLYGYSFVLLMEDPGPSRIVMKQHMAYHPFELCLTKGSCEQSIVLCWETDGDFGTVRIMVGEDSPEPLPGTASASP